MNITYKFVNGGKELATEIRTEPIGALNPDTIGVTAHSVSVKEGVDFLKTVVETFNNGVWVRSSKWQINKHTGRPVFIHKSRI